MPSTFPLCTDAFGEQLRQAAEAAGNTVLTYSLDSRAADVFAEKVKVRGRASTQPGVGRRLSRLLPSWLLGALRCAVASAF